MSEARITTRRARACVPGIRQPGDIEIAQTDQGEVCGRSFDRVTVIATLVDIGDPRFRLWLVGALAPRMRTVDGIIINLIAGQEP